MNEVMGARLKKLRLAKGLGVNEMALRLNKPVNTYRDWEKGRAHHERPYLQLAIILDVSIGTLLGVPQMVPLAIRKDWLLKDLEEILQVSP